MFRTKVEKYPSSGIKGEFDSILKFYFLGFCFYKKQIEFLSEKSRVGFPVFKSPSPPNRTNSF